MTEILRDHFGWAMLIAMLLIVLVTSAASFAAVELGLSRRIREIRALFHDALVHARSFDPAVERLRVDLGRTDALATDLAAQVVKHGEALGDHEARIRRIEERPGLALGRGE